MFHLTCINESNTLVLRSEVAKMNMDIGLILRNRRQELKLTMKQVANACGVSEATVSRWETGETDKIQRGSIFLLSKILYLPIEVILGIESKHDITLSSIIIKRNLIVAKMEKCSLNELESIEKFIDNFINNEGKS